MLPKPDRGFSGLPRPFEVDRDPVVSFYSLASPTSVG